MFVFSGSWDKWKRFCVLLLGVCTVNTSLVFWLQSLARFLVLALELQLLKCKNKNFEHLLTSYIDLW